MSVTFDDFYKSLQDSNPALAVDGQVMRIGADSFRKQLQRAWNTAQLVRRAEELTELMDRMTKALITKAH